MKKLTAIKAAVTFVTAVLLLSFSSCNNNNTNNLQAKVDSLQAELQQFRTQILWVGNP